MTLKDFILSRIEYDVVFVTCFIKYEYKDIFSCFNKKGVFYVIFARVDILLMLYIKYKMNT